MSGADAARGGSSETRSTPRSRAPAPLAADVAVVAAMSVEVGFLLDRLRRVRRYAGPRHTVVEGEHGGKVVAVVVGGAGRQAARRATDLLIDGHRPRWVVSAGFAGGLDPALRRNDTVLPDTVVDPEGHGFSVEKTSLTADASPRAGARVVSGRLVTVDAVARTAAEKADLRARTGADVVDMETSAVASACQARGARFLSVRVVSDEAGTDLPREILTLMNRKGSYLVGAALRAVWNRPSSLKDLLALHGHANEAADRLAEVLLAVLDRLPD